jgi:hypothetical protein
MPIAKIMTKNLLLPIFINLAGVSSFGRLRRRTSMDGMLEIAGSDGIRRT